MYTSYSIQYVKMDCRPFACALWMEMDSLQSKKRASSSVFRVFFSFLSASTKCCTSFTCNTGCVDLEKLYCYGWFLQCPLCQMDGWTQKNEGIVVLLVLKIHYLYPCLSFPLSVSASHLLPHALTLSEESLLLTPISSPYLALSFSLPLHSVHSLPIKYTCCRHKWACVSPVPQQSSHILIRFILVACLILLYLFSFVIG